MLIFGLHSTSDNWLSDPRDESRPECKKGPQSHQNMKCSFFLLCSTSDDRPSDPSDESQLKCKKGPLSHQKMTGSFLDHVQLLMIGRAIQVMKVNQNTKKAP